MDLYELPFAKITILHENIAEVIINEDVEMNGEMVDEYHAFLLSHLKVPFSLLVNKVNSYTYDFEAQRKLATLDEINKMAVVVYNRTTKVVTDYLATMPREVDWNLKTFNDYDVALSWLLQDEGNVAQIISNG